ncbi:unknown [Bacteroides sp. CAG:144]|nr:unknown [Bacteroides sp. CAG:144]
MMRAWARNVSSPSFRLMELTIPFPCIHFSPARMTGHFEESIIIGTRQISGSEAMRFRNVTISFCASSMASSILMSMICAPSSTCLRAIPRASSYFFSEISRKNLREPATLHRSPTLIKLFSGMIFNSSKPDKQSTFSLICGR